MSNTDPAPAAAELSATVANAASAFAGIPEPAASRVPGKDKWSPKQVLGHLIDSAANNHQRFVRARWQDDLMFHGYDQDDWVAAGDYAKASWTELVTLWAALNRQLARVVATLPAAVRTRVHTRHNLHELAWQTVAVGAPVTLDWFLADYVGHLRHHLRQIDALLGTRTG
ncbi:MAG TPA: DinB family protein [Planctomycetota bacterium]|nr:DinB family protein [Planctomycetota bacterium]